MPKRPRTHRRLTSSLALSFILLGGAASLGACENAVLEEETHFDPLLCSRPPPAASPEEVAPPDRNARRSVIAAGANAATFEEVLDHEASIAHIEATAQLDQEFSGATP